MIEQSLSNTNEKCYSTFLKKLEAQRGLVKYFETNIFLNNVRSDSKGVFVSLSKLVVP
jgi:hypothetical protein